MGPKYFCIGLGKTGTKTFGDIMKSTGYCHLNGPVNRGLVWHRTQEYNKIWNLTDQYQSFDDYPYPLMYRALADRYPNAVFFLTCRQSGEHWADSIIAHHRRYGPSDPQVLVFGSYPLESERNRLTDFYNSHFQNVKDFFQNDNQLLVIDWEDPASVNRFLLEVKSPMQAQDIVPQNRKEDYSAEQIVLRFLKKGRPGAALHYIDKLNDQEKQQELSGLVHKLAGHQFIAAVRWCLHRRIQKKR